MSEVTNMDVDSQPTNEQTITQSPDQAIQSPDESSEQSNGSVVKTTKRAAVPDDQPVQTPKALLHIVTPSGKSTKVEAVPSDLVVEIRQFLLTCPETCEYTCYHLSYNGQMIGDYNEIGAYAELCDGKSHTLQIMPELYDERAARAHVTRTREIIANPPVKIKPTNLVTVDELAAQESAKRKKKQKTSAPNVPVQLTSNISLAEMSTHALQTRAPEPSQPLVHSILYSAWNPPPGNRKLRGDLLYLVVSTIEGHNLHITGAVDGWFLNRSTDNAFDPREASPSFRSSTLTELIRQASQIFASRFDNALKRVVTLHTFAQSETASRPIDWAASKADLTHKPDWNRSENSTLTTFGMERSGPRDWNDEFQGCNDMPVLSAEDGPKNDAHLQRVYAEFVAAAREGAQAVVNGHISPANPLDDPRHHVFIFNNIFFSYAVDTREVYAECGGDEVARKHASCDLKGIEAFLDAGIPDLHNLATCLVDYRGHRVVCQSIIPGIFHADRATKHVYGSMEGGEIVDSSKEESKQVVELISEASKITHSKTHHVIDRDDKSHELVSSVDTKGIVGSDNRTYVLDLFRTTPRDSNWPEKEYTYAVVRRELLTKFCRQQVMNGMFPAPVAEGETAPKTETEAERDARQMHNFLTRQSEQMQKLVEKEQAKAEAAKSGESMETTEDAEPTMPDIDDEYLKKLAAITFNNDVLVHIPSNSLPEDEAKNDLTEVQKLGAFLTDSVLPSFVRRLKSLDLTPADGEHLVRLMHENGINARYLGYVAERCEPHTMSHLVFLTQTEMIARCARDILHAHLRELQPRNGKRVEAWFYGASLVKFLNALLGVSGLGVAVSDAQTDAASEKRKAGKGKKSADVLTHVGLWQAICESAKHKFRYTFTGSVVLTANQKVTLLRSICRKTGIKVLARDYAFASNEVVSIDDIVDLEPVVKKLNLKSADAEAMFDTVQVTMSQNQLTLAYQYLLEAMAVGNAIYGVVSEKVAPLMEMLALVCYQAGELGGAAAYQQRAVVIYERCCGLDDARTAHAHMQLALYLHSGHLTEAALVHATRATYLLRLLTGGLHPDVASAYHNVGMLYQCQGKYSEGFDHVRRALEINVTVLGDSHVQVGFSHHAMAVAYALMGDYREAVTSETRCKRILTAELGASAERVALSGKWLNHLTSLSVKASGNKTAPPSSASSICPPETNTKSPFLWMNLHAATQGFRPRFRINDVLALIEIGPITERRAKHRQQVTERALKDQAELDAENPMRLQRMTDDEQVPPAKSKKSKANKKKVVAVVTQE